MPVTEYGRSFNIYIFVYMDYIYRHLCTVPVISECRVKTMLSDVINGMEHVKARNVYLTLRWYSELASLVEDASLKGLPVSRNTSFFPEFRILF